MAKSIIQSIRNSMGPNSDGLDISPELEKRIQDVSGIFPSVDSVLPVPEIDPEWCFRAQTPNGDRFLIWTNTVRLTGLVKSDGDALFPDFEASRKLEHENILTPLHITKAGDLAIVVTADFKGQSLIGLLKNRKQPLETVKEIFGKLTNAVNAAHDAGVMHRSLCPANVLVDDDLNIRVFGFGMANVFFDRWRHTIENRNRRIVDYIAPEIQNDGLSKVAPNCDCFSIGRIIYEMLLGQLPKNAILVLPSKVCRMPAFMDDAILNSMHGEPPCRPQSIEEFRDKFYGNSIREPIERIALPTEKEQKKDGMFDGSFSWIQSDTFRLALALLFIGSLLIAALIHEKNKDRSIPVALQGGMSIEELLERWEEMSIEELKRLYQEHKEQFEAAVEGVSQIMMANEDFDEASKFMKKMEGICSGEFDKKLAGMLAELDEYSEMMDTAEEARILGNPIAEEAALARANELIPSSKTTLKFQRQNPRRIALELSRALDELKELNPAQENWHFHLLVSHDRVTLDLAGHQNLTDISSLREKVIHELNLANTGIENLHDLVAMPIEELRLDGTKITDLDMLTGLPLQVLTFKNTAIKDVSRLKHIPTLRCIIGQNTNGPVLTIHPPLPGQRTWINETGLKFRALPGIPVLMAEREYPAKNNGQPMTSISFNEAENLCSHMTMRQRMENKIAHNQRYRLPTDGEWSYAALLPESQMLSPKGRMLQYIEEADFRANQENYIVLEISEGSKLDEDVHNGFQGMSNSIGEWVDHPRSQWDTECIARGIYSGITLDNLRYRTKQKTETPARMIGFRPVLEIDSKKIVWNSLQNAKPTQLAKLALNSRQNPHLSAAASSSLLLKSLHGSSSYRNGYISTSHGNRDPFTNRRYLRVDLPVPWAEAKSIAHQLGGRLATAQNEEHLAWLHEQYVRPDSLRTPLWVGASAYAEKANWTWVTRQPVSQNFKPKPVDNDKRRAALLTPGPEMRSTLTGTPVTERHSFLVEWEPLKATSKASPVGDFNRN